MVPRRITPDTCSAQLALDHWDRLTRAHDQLLAALADKRAATREPDPNPIAVCRARWNFGRASRHHRTLVGTILADLLIGASTSDLAAISTLRKEGLQQMQRSTGHIQKWTPERIMTDWRLFCAESAEIQADTHQRISTEEQLIRRLLKRRALTADQAGAEP
jgi:hypothetical protein